KVSAAQVDATKTIRRPGKRIARSQGSSRLPLLAAHRRLSKNSRAPGSAREAGLDLPNRCAVCVKRAASSAVPAAGRDTRTASPFAPRGQVFPRPLKRAESCRGLEREFYRD